MPSHLQVIALDRITYEDDVDVVILPSIDGQLGVLPRHAPIVTALQTGEIVARKSGDEISIAVSGGFVQVSPEAVIVLADAAERAEEIDVARAQAARERAQERVTDRSTITDLDVARAEAALSRSLARIRVAEKSTRHPGSGSPPVAGAG
jgi:F-type H+-transporting ATPase subunit epsilon